MLIAPTRIYVKPVLKLLGEVPVKGLAHITGGGLVENVPRVLPDAVCAVLDGAAWPLPPLFRWLQEQGNVAAAEMHRVFNCGIGMVIVVAPGDVDRATTLLRSAGETVYRIGAIEPRPAGGAATVVR